MNFYNIVIFICLFANSLAKDFIYNLPDNFENEIKRYFTYRDILDNHADF